MQHGHNTSLDDFACIDACLDGQPERFGALVDRYQDSIFALVSRMVSDPEATRDLAQETFLRAFRGLRSFKRDSSFVTWLYRIAINVCQSERRKILRQKRIGGRPQGGVADPDEQEREIPDTTQNPLDRLRERERKELVLDALNRIESEFREILVLRDFQFLSYQEIAEILECPVGTVRSRLFRARAEIRWRLEKALGGVDR